MTNEKTFTIDIDKIKSKLGKIFDRLEHFYTKLNQDLIFFWRKILPTNEPGLLGWIFRFIRAMLDNPATALLINTILFAIIGTIFGGLINNIAFILAGLNILVFCTRILR